MRSKFVAVKDRYIEAAVTRLALVSDKMGWVSGPRQVGRTTLAKRLLEQRGAGRYHNWDQLEFRRLWARTPGTALEVYPRPPGVRPLIVLDEIHKAPRWKQTLKGLYDTRPEPLDLVVTGSARLNVYQRGGDSMAGRYRHFRLHPFSVAEAIGNGPASPEEFQGRLASGDLPASADGQTALATLLEHGGFPEPFLAQDAAQTRLWRRNRDEQVLREDLRDLSRVAEIGKAQMLAVLLPERVGSLFSRNSLREDIGVAFETLDRWLRGLELLYYVFEVRPYARRVGLSLKKGGKLYLWEYTSVPSGPARFENLVACHLLKACHYWTDTGAGDFALWLLRDREQREIDFLITRDGQPWLPIEVKQTATQPEPAWNKFLPTLACPRALQLVQQGVPELAAQRFGPTRLARYRHGRAGVVLVGLRFRIGTTIAAGAIRRDVKAARVVADEDAHQALERPGRQYTDAQQETAERRYGTCLAVAGTDSFSAPKTEEISAMR
ncbi:MAG: ATP-binding protein [Verrucomicrobia bacterium]|nr:ATP-binding protein [Verrucomicrobiota bacterium]